jgi:glycosyltransferase involved in cell wall biosynthesis
VFKRDRAYEGVEQALVQDPDGVSLHDSEPAGSPGFVFLNNDGPDGLARPRQILSRMLVRRGVEVLFASLPNWRWTRGPVGTPLRWGGLRTVESHLRWWHPPVPLRLFQKPLFRITSECLRGLALWMVTRFTGHSRSVVFASVPSGSYNFFLRLHRPVLTVYNVHDRFLMPDGSRWVPTHAPMLRHADVVLCGSQALVDELRTQTLKPVHHFPPAVDASIYLKSEMPTPPKRQPGEWPVVGTIGNFGSQVDWALLLKLARRLPVRLRMVGTLTADIQSNRAVRALQTLPNVEFVSKVSQAELPSVIADLDVCVLPYRLTPYTWGIEPLKFYEFMAMGKPVVASDIPSLRNRGELIQLAHDPEEWMRAIRELLAHDAPEARQARRRFASHNTYSHRLNQLQRIVGNALQDRDRADVRQRELGRNRPMVAARVEHDRRNDPLDRAD